jgi:phage portal protein BeeE
MVALWNQPNKFYSGSTLMKGLAFSWATRSEAYILKAVNTVGEVLELWYEPPWSIRPVWPVDGSEYISYYEVNRNGTWYPVQKEYVVHLRDGFHPYNQRIGFETSVAILPELAGDKEAAYYYANLMSGSGVPPFIVGIDPQTKMNDVQARQLQQRLVQGTTGDKKGEPVVIAGGKAYRLGFTPRELNLEETRYMPEDSFCAVKGCPAVVLELGAGRAHSIYNNVQAAEERAWRSYVKPLLRHIREELTSQLLVDFEDVDEQGRITTGAYLDHDFSDVQALQEDRDAKAKRIGGLLTDGVIMLSEARSEMGYGPSDGEDWEKDKIYKIVRGVTLIKPGEQPMPQGEEIVDMATGKVTRQASAPAPPSPFGAQPGQPTATTPPTEEQQAKSIRLRIAEARRLRALPPAPPESNGNGHHRLEL